MITEAALLQFFGRLHPLVLHLPIGLWIGIALLEFGGALVRRRAATATIATLAWAAALAGALAAAAGWVLALEGTFAGRTLELHRWLGAGAGALGLLAAAFAGLQARRPFQLLLLSELAVLTAAGHFGSELTHGDDWLTEPFAPAAASVGVDAVAPPATIPPPEPTAPSTNAAVRDLAPAVSTPAPAATPRAAGERTFAGDVQPLLEQRCGKCHGAQKPKGKLALHTQEAIAKGGKNGPAVLAGDPDASPLLQRLLLPLDDDEHMPPAEKPQPTAAEIELLRAWIAAGAPFENPFRADAKAPPPTRPDAANGTDSPAPGGTTPGDDPAPERAPPVPTQPPPTGPQRGGVLGAAPAPPAATLAANPIVEAVAPRQPAAAAATTAAVAIERLRARFVHTAPMAQGDDGLWIDFAGVAPTTTDAEVDALLSPLAERIVDLGLARAPVGDALVPLLLRMPRLERLDLGHTRITGSGLGALAAHPHLARLVLAGTPLDDAAVDAMLRMPALRRAHVWDSGLSFAAIARLRQRRDLIVDAGEAPVTTPQELEPPPPGQPAPTAPAAAPLVPVNAVCPVSGKPVDARFVIVHDGRALGFCCANCPAQFWAAPAQYPVVVR